MADQAQPQGCSFRASVSVETIASGSGNATESESERWLPAVGFEGWYEVSDFGRVRRIRKPAGAPTCRILKSSPDTWGYRTVGLSVHGVHFTRRVHLLVADAFIGPRPDGYEIDHEDGVKANCRLGNLETVTHGENQRRAYALGVHRPRGADKKPRRARAGRVDRLALAMAIVKAAGVEL